MTCAEVNSHLYQARRTNGPSFTRLSHSPVSAAHRQVKTLAEEIGVAFLGLGFQPKWSVADTPAMPKARERLASVSRARTHPDAPPPAQGRYKIMREYMPKVGSMGLDMMFRTCTVQARSAALG